MNDHRPWMVAIPATVIDPDERVTIAMTSPRSTPSMRKITLLFWGHDMLLLESAKLGSIETGHELLETGPISAIIFKPDQPETFDVPVEEGQEIVLILRNRGSLPIDVSGVLLGLAERPS